MDADHHHQTQAREKSVDKKLHGPKDDHQEHQKSQQPSSSSSSSCSSSQQHQQQQQQQQQVTISAASPPSASSSPSHEFSFTISLHSSSSNNPTSTATNDNNKKSQKSKIPPPSFAIDLSPADDIFFHGHLLPLHLLSHLPVSPRSSTNSLESFTLPIKDLSSSDNNHGPTKDITHKNSSSSATQKTEPTTKGSSRNKPKSSSFSLFGLKWRRAYELGSDQREDNSKEKPKRKLRFEVSHVLKRYMRMVRPLLFFGKRGRENRATFHLRRQPYSFSGILNSRNNSNKENYWRGRRRGPGEYSAPASMRTSPSNSGLLVATATLPSAASDSTMEELQAAIQAAIAHCKNSIASEDHKLKCS